MAMQLRSGRRLASPPPAPRGDVRRGRPRRTREDGGGGGDDGEDRISGLPEELLLDVLRRLGCDRQAARTSVLSHRWRSLWVELRELSFTGLRIDAVETALARVRPKLNYLNIGFTVDNNLTGAQITSPLRGADRLAPAVLSLSLSTEICVPQGSTFELPCFGRATSIDLGVAGLNFTLAPAGKFACLEKLILKLDCSVVDLGVLLSRCPRLRKFMMVVSTRRWIDTIAVESKSLEELKVVTCTNSPLDVVIVAPELRASIMEKFEPAPSNREERERRRERGAGDSAVAGTSGRRSFCVAVIGVGLACNTESNQFQWGQQLTHAQASLVLAFCFARSRRSISLALKELYLVFYLSGTVFGTVSHSAPKLEEFLLRYIYDLPRVGLGDKWRLGRLNMQTHWSHRNGSHYVLSLTILNNSGHTPAERSFAQEVARLPVNHFSVLELSIRTSGHVFALLLLHLLLIRTSIQSLMLVLITNNVPECSENCDCDQDGNWRNQEISLPGLQHVQIQGFSAADHEVDFLQLVFRSAPTLKRMNVQLSDEVSPSDGGCQKLRSIFDSHASVKCNVYDKSGDVISFA